MNARKLIKILEKDPKAIVWLGLTVFDEVEKVEYERENKNYAYFLLKGKVQCIGEKINDSIQNKRIS